MSFKKEEIIKALDGFKPEKVEQFATYCTRLLLEKDKQGKLKNEWISRKDANQLAVYFKRVAQDEGMFLDGVNVTLTSRGIQYDYKAYKNRVMLLYPESIIDNQLVYKDDEYKFWKESGHVCYKHEFNNPFNQTDADVIGAYCIIKNKRGEFITTLGLEDISKHRKVAKTDTIWQGWFKEMCLKTAIKKACSLHFNDVFTNIVEIDNENCNIDNPQAISIEDKAKIDEIQSVENLRKFYIENKEKFTNKELLLYIQNKQKELANKEVK